MTTFITFLPLWHKGGEILFLKALFCPTFVLIAFLYSFLLQFHPLQSFFIRPKGIGGPWPDKPPLDPPLMTSKSDEE